MTLTSSPPTSNVSNALTDKATSSGPPRPDSTAGSGSKLTPGVDGWVTSWGLTVCPPFHSSRSTLTSRTRTTKRRSMQSRLLVRKLLGHGHGVQIGIGSQCSALPSPRKSLLKTLCKLFVTCFNIKLTDRYTRLMASYNPAMIKGEALTADWKAAPDLTSFAASYTGGPNVTMSGGGSAAGTGGSPASASVSPTAAIGIAASGNGAGRSLFTHLVQYEADSQVESVDRPLFSLCLLESSDWLFRSSRHAECDSASDVETRTMIGLVMQKYPCTLLDGWTC